MAKVLVSMKIFPSDVDTDLDLLKTKIEKALPGYASVYGFDEEPIAFGLVALIAHILLPEDRSGGMDEVEAILQGIEGISQLEPQMVRRV
ncbi:MAG: elongation factor 1-beta [Candidatus Bathyarchaeota archaeon]|nr:elongation factor 1-beta [Candidatus Bathyarchaeota archaeon]MDH5689799.1 elongation factor 1-beta [Candidatus Bathyarchaeota archaeon]